jgi:hypothetical protein
MKIAKQVSGGQGVSSFSPYWCLRCRSVTISSKSSQLDGLAAGKA